MVSQNLHCLYRRLNYLDFILLCVRSMRYTHWFFVQFINENFSEARMNPILHFWLFWYLWQKLKKNLQFFVSSIDFRTILPGFRWSYYGMLGINNGILNEAYKYLRAESPMLLHNYFSCLVVANCSFLFFFFFFFLGNRSIFHLS